MATAVQKFHEEEAIGKTYDSQIARRLLRYLRPYLRLLVPALLLTLALNGLRVLQPKFTQYAIDWYIVPCQSGGVPCRPGGLVWLALAMLAVLLLTFLFSYAAAVLLNTIGQHVMYDLRAELYEKLQHQEVAYFDR
ncbi:MAG TPA: ABC transporter transmembrane domain-containing protein, partial [Pyrinomonadaceae bacterium]